jgi:redox-regulated HSP33 family molecular chaperone
LLSILAAMPDDDKLAMVKDGVITMTCQFCSTAYVFSPDELGGGKDGQAREGH